MITVLQLIFSPVQTWEKIAKAERGVLRILLIFVFPFLLTGLALEGFSLVRWGERRGEFDYVVKISREMAVVYTTSEFVLLLCSLFIGAKCLQWITHSFQVRTSFTPCFTLMAYGFGPIFLARYLDAVPGLNSWVCWILGALLSASALYHGVCLALKPEQTKGFGLYLVSMIIAFLSSGLSHFVAIAILHGKIVR